MVMSLFRLVKRKVFKEKKLRLRQRINVTQHNKQYTFTGYLSNDNYSVKKLWLKNRVNEKIIEIENEEVGTTFNFTLNLNDIADQFTDEEAGYDFYLIVRISKSYLTDRQINHLQDTAKLYVDEHDQKFYEYPIRLGRFTETIHNDLFPICVNKATCLLYKTVKGNISLMVNKEVEQKITTHIDYLKVKKYEVKLGGKIFTKSHEIEQMNFIMLGRNSGKVVVSDVSYEHLIQDTIKKFGLNRYTYKINIKLNDLFKEYELQDDVYDLYFEIKLYHSKELLRVRIGRPRFRARFKLKSSRVIYNNTIYSINPYYTFRRSSLSLEAEAFTSDTYNYLRKIMRWSYLINLFYRKKDIWLIGERINKAQDTGYHLFKYIRENYPERNVYYVIDENSPEVDNLSHLGNVLYNRSKEHIKATIAASRIIGSHHPDYLYPTRSDEFNKKVRGKKVFLQHGVIGTKNMLANYGKTARGFKTDLFLVSSDQEKEIIVNDFEYDRRDVAVTGLSRFDALFKDDVPAKRQILIIPTWREWLLREDLFLESEYFERYKTLIYSEKLNKLAKTYNFEIVLSLHANMQKYIDHFADAPIKLIKPGEVDIQHLLKESALMITDYSSVAFDFSFLNKPVIYYQFDRNRFIGKRGSHIDLNNDLPGDIVYEQEDIIDLVADYAQDEFNMKEEHERKASRFYKYKDRHSSERIYKAIKNDIRTKLPHEQFMETELYRTLFNRFRKSNYYFPTMKWFYKIAKKMMSVDEKLILFESNIGKQYSDSPRYIYEELVRQGADYKKVWVCNQPTRFQDPHTIRIKRNSPSYFYYLAKAKVWVNNQNFAAHLEKRPETTYIQTWHGTPLKKMLHDIDNVMGRADNYIDRISKAIKRWDTLISPSEYATSAFKSAFQYEGPILETGYPRNDLFYHEDKEEIIEKVRRRLVIPKQKKVILYAPTFRDNKSTRTNHFTFDIQMDLQKMREELGDEYIVLLRMHIAITSKIKLDEQLDDFIMDVSNYPDMQELLLVANILITDYSSCMFDFANTRRPILFFAYDLESYRDNVRGFYLDFEKEAPGPIVRTTDEIINYISNIEEMERTYMSTYETFYNRYCSIEDGRASERIVNQFFNHK